MSFKSFSKKNFYLFIYFLTTLALVGTLLPIIPEEEWYIRIFDFPRLQLLCITLLALFLFTLFIFRKRNWQLFLMLSLLAAMVYQAYRIFPYTPLANQQVLELAPSEVEDGLSLSLMVSNVYMENDEYNQLLKEIDKQQPDIILTLETDKKWQAALNSLKSSYPHTVEVPLDNTYGMLLHSRLPLLNPEVHYLVQGDIPSIITRVQLPSGRQVQLYCVHPRPPAPTESDDSEERDAEIVLIGKKAQMDELPVIVAGDFNDVAWSPTTRLFQEVSTLLDPRKGRGFYNTFNAEYPLMRWPLDHFFHSEDFKLIRISRLPYVGSDHFPIFIELQLDAQAPVQQEAQKPDSETEQEARQTIQEGT